MNEIFWTLPKDSLGVESSLVSSVMDSVSWNTFFCNDSSHIKLTLQSCSFKEIGRSYFLFLNSVERLLKVLHKFLGEFRNFQVQPILTFCWKKRCFHLGHVYLMHLERKMWSTQKQHTAFINFDCIMDLMLVVNMILNCIVTSFFQHWVFYCIIT